ncbi:MAG: hypothetical protein ACFYI8_00945 [Candidatus Karelsulcia muelleri]
MEYKRAYKNQLKKIKEFEKKQQQTKKSQISRRRQNYFGIIKNCIILE